MDDRLEWRDRGEIRVLVCDGEPVGELFPAALGWGGVIYGERMGVWLRERDLCGAMEAAEREFLLSKL